MASRGKSQCAAFKACCRWPRSTARRWWRMPAPWPWKWALALTLLSAAIWSGSAIASGPAASRSTHPRTHRIPRFHSKQNPGERTMNLIELQRALRQLRLGGIATGLETRLRQAQCEAMAPIDLISCLISDELSRRSERLLDRRRKQAEFRDSHKTLDQ